MRLAMRGGRRRMMAMMQALAVAGIATTASGQVPGDTVRLRSDSAASRVSPAAPPGAIAPGVSAGSRREDYLRTLQTLGIVRPYPWSLRGFSPREIDLLRPQTDSHPRSAASEFQGDSLRLGRGFSVLPASGDVWLNSSFPFGLNDGAVWRGRGLTAAISGGVQGRWGPVSLTFAPIAFVAQNADFPLMDNGVEGPLRFGDGQYAGGVDLPQRFGDGAYAVLDPGQSSLRFDTRYVAFGASTANQAWGPMSEFPVLLGDKAAGFPHVFFGTGSPVNIFIGSLHARVMYGQLGQSDYSPIVEPEPRRFASGIAAVFSPRGLPTLEIGAGRFFHMVWPQGGPGSYELRRPFESFFKSSLSVTVRAGDDTLTHVENQLAGVFFRWVFPSHGLEVYGETGREDHNWDQRDLVLELDHSATYGIGLRKAWRTPGRIRVFRGETMNFQLRTGALHRGEGGIYLHAPIRQGHTHRGQLLGAGFGVASASGTVLAFEQHDARRSTTVAWSRFVRQERFRELIVPPWELNLDSTDVQHALEVEHRFDRGGRQFRVGLGGVYEFNRNFGKDAFNLMLSGGIDLFPARRARAVSATPPPTAGQ